MSALTQVFATQFAQAIPMQVQATIENRMHEQKLSNDPSYQSMLNAQRSIMDSMWMPQVKALQDELTKLVSDLPTEAHLVLVEPYAKILIGQQISYANVAKSPADREAMVNNQFDALVNIWRTNNP